MSRDVFRHHLGFAVFLSNFILGSCQHVGSRSDVAGVFMDNKSIKWSSTKLSICWENPAGEADTEKEIAREAIVREYNRKTLFEFTGFKQCDETATNLRLRFTDFARVLAWGQYLDNMPNGINIFTIEYLKSLNSSYYNTESKRRAKVQQSTLHELGHAIGLMHEHTHPNVDGNCGTPSEHTRIRVLTDYDPKSIMNYCNVITDENVATYAVLSDKDIESIAILYGPNSPFSAKDPALFCTEAGGKWVFSEIGCCQLRDRDSRPTNIMLIYCEDEIDNCAQVPGRWVERRKCCLVDKTAHWPFNIFDLCHAIAEVERPLCEADGGQWDIDFVCCNGAVPDLLTNHFGGQYPEFLVCD